MNTSKITELVRDYLYLTSKQSLRKAEYQRRITLISEVMSDTLRSKLEPEEESIDEYMYRSSQEAKSERDAQTLFGEYLQLVRSPLAKWLDGKIEPYICPGSGDTYRHYVIDKDEESLTIKCKGDPPSQEELKTWLSQNLLYPVEVKLERVAFVVGRPRWQSY